MNLSIWWRVLLVVVGGGIGSIARYLIGGWIQSWRPECPVGTLAVNGAGCLILGCLSVWTFEHGWIGHEGRLLWMVGLMGGLPRFRLSGTKRWFSSSRNTGCGRG